MIRHLVVRVERLEVNHAVAAPKST